ncbi:MAG: decaprenyl-phosphate phosphoribosyltransferase [Thermaerobacter sp.]|nr:decaprenyl-phosphate phosphoribosyltransferase [Thermaerobacter sp.]
MSTIGALWELARPRQWSKNAFVLAAPLFSARLASPPVLERSLLLVAAFCLLSSAVYAANDLWDRRWDRGNPLKRHRPLSSGRITPGAAVSFALALGFLGLGTTWWSGPSALPPAAAFLALNLLYSLVLKGLVLIDVFAIAASFLLRALAGAALVGVAASPWLFICTILLALFLGFAKRRHELSLLGEAAANCRRVLGEYSLAFLDHLLTVLVASLLMAYSLWALSRTPAHSPYLIGTVPLVAYGIFRYLYLVHRRQAGAAPEEVPLRDRPLLATVLLWGAAVSVLTYLPH